MRESLIAKKIANNFISSVDEAKVTLMSSGNVDLEVSFYPDGDYLLLKWVELCTPKKTSVLRLGHILNTSEKQILDACVKNIIYLKGDFSLWRYRGRTVVLKDALGVMQKSYIYTTYKLDRNLRRMEPIDKVRYFNDLAKIVSVDVNRDLKTLALNCRNSFRDCAEAYSLSEESFYMIYKNLIRGGSYISTSEISNSEMRIYSKLLIFFNKVEKMFKSNRDVFPIKDVLREVNLVGTKGVKEVLRVIPSYKSFGSDLNLFARCLNAWSITRDKYEKNEELLQDEMDSFKY